MPTQPVRRGGRARVLGLRGRRRARPARRRSGAWTILRHFPRILPFLRPHWKLVVVSTSLIFGYVLLGLATPWTFAIVVDNVLGRRPLSGVLQQILGGLSTY